MRRPRMDSGRCSRGKERAQRGGWLRAPALRLPHGGAHEAAAREHAGARAEDPEPVIPYRATGIPAFASDKVPCGTGGEPVKPRCDEDPGSPPGSTPAIWTISWLA